MRLPGDDQQHVLLGGGWHVLVIPAAYRLVKGWRLPRAAVSTSTPAPSLNYSSGLADMVQAFDRS